MAGVTGPLSPLPGSTHGAPDGAVCDQHPGRASVARVQGETDSFGSEMHDLCEECLDEYHQQARDCDTSGVCDWCKRHADRRRPRRDHDEGLCGPVYWVCDDCIIRVNNQADLT